MKVSVIKKQDDPITLRISIGGTLNDAYFVYRGDLDLIKKLLEQVNERIQKDLDEDPPISPDEGKKYA